MVVSSPASDVAARVAALVMVRFWKTHRLHCVRVLQQRSVELDQSHVGDQRRHEVYWAPHRFSILGVRYEALDGVMLHLVGLRVANRYVEAAISSFTADRQRLTTVRHRTAIMQNSLSRPSFLDAVRSSQNPLFVED